LIFVLTQGTTLLSGDIVSPCTESSHQKVRIAQRQTATQAGELHCGTRAVAIGIVIQRAGGTVVEDEVVGIDRTDSDTCTERACRQRAGAAQGAENGVLQFDGIGKDVEVGEGVDIVQRVEQAVEANGVAARPPAQGVVAQAAVEAVVAVAAFEAVGAVVAAEGVIKEAADEVFDADQGVVAGAASGLTGAEVGADGGAGEAEGDRVVAGGAVEDVVAGASVEEVVEGVAGAVGGAVGEQAQSFDVVGQGVGRQVAVDEVVAAAGAVGIAFDDQVAEVVDVVVVAAVAADEGVGTAFAVEAVVAEAAFEAVVAVVAAQPVVVLAADEVFDVDQGVVAGAATGLAGAEVDTDGGAGEAEGDRVVAGGAVEDVVAGAGVEEVVEGVAGSVGGAVGEQAQSFDVVGQGVGRQVAVNEVVAAAGEVGVAFDDQVAEVVDVVVVAAVATDQGVGTAFAVEAVVAEAAFEAVVAVVAAQPVVVLAADEVFDVDQGVVAGAATGLAGAEVDTDGGAGEAEGDRVVAGGAVEDVVAGAGVEEVVEGVAGSVGGAVGEQAQSFDVVGQGVGRQVAVDEVVAGAAGEVGVAFDDQVAGVIDVVVVAAVATDQGVAVPLSATLLNGIPSSLAENGVT
jgi:hypothetical protein